jgi:hypothetical protein
MSHGPRERGVAVEIWWQLDPRLSVRVLGIRKFDVALFDTIFAVMVSVLTRMLLGRSASWIYLHFDSFFALVKEIISIMC